MTTKKRSGETDLQRLINSEDIAWLVDDQYKAALKTFDTEIDRLRQQYAKQRTSTKRQRSK